MRGPWTSEKLRVGTGAEGGRTGSSSMCMGGVEHDSGPALGAEMPDNGTALEGRETEKHCHGDQGRRFLKTARPGRRDPLLLTVSRELLTVTH